MARNLKRAHLPIFPAKFPLAVHNNSGADGRSSSANCLATAGVSDGIVTTFSKRPKLCKEIELMTTKQSLD